MLRGVGCTASSGMGWVSTSRRRWGTFFAVVILNRTQGAESLMSSPCSQVKSSGSGWCTALTRARVKFSRYRRG